MYFPRADASLRPIIQENVEPLGSARILVVDDEPIQLRTARRLLTHFRYEVGTVASGRTAIALFAKAAQTGQSPYDLILLDMILNEELDGLQVFDEIRRKFPTQRAIIVSGHAPTERAERAFAEGLGWLAKPYTAEALASAVRTALSRQGDDPSERPSVNVKLATSSSVPAKVGNLPDK